MEIENEPEEFGGISVKVVKVKNFPSGNYSRNEEDPLKINPKVEIIQESFEFHSVGLLAGTGTINYNNDLDDSFQNEEMRFCVLTDDSSPEEDPLEGKLIIKDELKDAEVILVTDENPAGNAFEEDCCHDFFCVQCKIACRLEDSAPKKCMEFFCVDSHVISDKEALRNWLKMHSELESRLTCLSTFLRCFDMEKHDSTSENVYYCSECHVVMFIKENIIFHVKKYYKVNERTLRESENNLKESVVGAEQHYSASVRNGLFQNEIHSKSSKLIKRKSKKFSNSGNHEIDYKCEHCPKVFKYYSDLCSHFQTHSDEKLFVCEHCEKSFLSFITLKRHMQTSCYSKLPRRLQTHTADKPFVCEHCKISFSELSYLKQHILTHTGEKPFVCEHCKKLFTQKGALKRHLQSHLNKKQFVCELCKKSFARVDFLKRHRQTHSGEKPNVCEHCKKSFAWLRDLKRHMQIHTGLKLFLCEYCKKSFRLLHHLKRHVKNSCKGKLKAITFGRLQKIF